MRKYLVFLCVAVLGIMGASDVFAGGIDSRTNWSAEYSRTLSRNAATDSVDAVVYNPAGTVNLKNGLHIGFTNQYIIKKQTQTIEATDLSGFNTALGGNYGRRLAMPTNEFSDTTPIPLYPSLFLAFKTGEMAVFGAMTVVGGGGTVAYDEMSYSAYKYLNGITGGTQSSMSADLKSSDIYYAFTVGGAYDVVKDMVSVSVAGRVIMQDKKVELKGSSGSNLTGLAAGGGVESLDLDVKYGEHSRGFGGILGVNIKPVKEMTVGIRYETVTRLIRKYNIKDDEVIVGSTGLYGANAANTVKNTLSNRQNGLGDKYYSRDLPPVLGLGIAYQVMDGLTVSASYTAYFTKDANWQEATNPRETPGTQQNLYSGVVRGKQIQKNYDTSHDAGIGVEFDVTKELRVSAGYQYTLMGTRESWYKEQPESIEFPYANSVALGFRFMAMEGLAVNFGVVRAFYPEFKTNKIQNKEFTNDLAVPNTTYRDHMQSITYKKDVWNISFGVNYSI